MTAVFDVKYKFIEQLWKMRIDSFSWFSVNPKNSQCFLQSLFSIIQYHEKLPQQKLSLPESRFMNVIYEQYLILEYVENFWQNLNFSPRTNRMKAIIRNPSNVYQLITSYLMSYILVQKSVWRSSESRLGLVSKRQVWSILFLFEISNHVSNGKFGPLSNCSKRQVWSRFEEKSGPKLFF